MQKVVFVGLVKELLPVGIRKLCACGEKENQFCIDLHHLKPRVTEVDTGEEGHPWKLLIGANKCSTEKLLDLMTNLKVQGSKGSLLIRDRKLPIGSSPDQTPKTAPSPAASHVP